MKRRYFLKTASFAALGPSVCHLSCNAAPRIPLIDTHQHLCDLELFPLRWLKPPIDRNFLMEDYLNAVEGQNLVKIIYMEVGVPDGHKKKEAEWALELCKDRDNPMVGAVISADPLAFLPKEREVPREPRHDRNQWYEEIKRLAQRPNIICKISGIVDNAGTFPLSAEDLAPIIDFCLESFGSDRVMFAGDWPVCLRNMSLVRWIETLKEVVANRPLADQKKLFHDNAAAFCRV